MDKKNLLDLISLGESQNLEFKESFSSSEIRKKIKNTICAFANTEGGKILVGVRDDGSICGVRTNNDILSQSQQLGRQIDPYLNLNVFLVETVLVIEVFRSSFVHSTNNGTYFVRYGTDTQKLTTEEVRSLFERKNKIVFEERENTLFKLKSDFNFNAFENFKKIAKINNDLQYVQLLENIGLLNNGYLNNAGVLFFCKDIYKFFKNATIQIFLYKGKSDYDILDSKEYKEDIFSNFKKSFDYLKQKLNTENIIESTFRKNVLELPEVVLREALLNAFSHRDYTSTANIQIHIYWDKVEITSAGGLPYDLKFEDLGKKRHPRNILICDMFQRMGLVEEAGSGIKRIRSLMKEAKLQVEFEVESNFFTIRLYRNVVTSKFEQPTDNLRDVGTNVGTNVGTKLTKSQRHQLILKAISENSDNFSQRSFAKELGVNPKTIERDLKELNNFVYYDEKEGTWRLK